MKTRFLLPLLVLLLIPHAFADFDLAKWQYVKGISLAENHPSGPVLVTVSPEVEAVSPELNDVRILDDRGTEVPYAFLSREDVRGAPVSHPRILDQGSRDITLLGDFGRSDGKQERGAGTRTMLILDFGGTSGRVYDHLTFSINAPNFRQRAAVFASDTLLPHNSGKWSSLTVPPHEYVYNYVDERAGWSHGNTTIAIPATTARYLRIVLEGPGTVPIVVKEVIAEGRGEEILSSEAGKDVSAVVSQDATNKTTVLTMDSGYAHFRSHGMVLQSGSENFDRRVVIERSDDGNAWMTVGEDSISRIQTPLMQGSRMAVSYPETRARYLRAVVYNYDDRPLSFSNPTILRTDDKQLFFEAEAGRSYRLFYGNPAASAPVYDLLSRRKYLELVGAMRVGLLESPQQPNPVYVAPTPAPIPWHQRYPAAINTILIACVLAVGALVFAYLKKAKT